ncbi:MAG TPA: DUF748 domain-containing protein [Methylotenera sp.]|nr:DUF748 domain-containing protein [Methylotenera sp.]HPH05405.1 DUF748 domain-containing protein [Methylotenera sp.]HPN01528.1 DUF748 domain-containing protein [Methylotenera sp.]
MQKPLINSMLKKLKPLLVSLPAKIVIGLCLFYLLFSYFGINPLAKKLVPWFAEKQLASKASVGRAAFDPFRLKTTIENFNLTDKNGTPLASFEKLVVDLEASGLFDWAWKLKEVELTAPKGLIAISPQGKLNWADLVAKLNEGEKPAPSNTLPRVVIEHFAIKRGNVQYSDSNRPTPLKAELSPLDFELEGFSTLPKDRGNYLFAAKFAEHGGAFKWKGDMGVNPVASKGAVALENIKLVKMLQIIKGLELPFTANSGDIGASFSYDFSLVKDQPKIALSQISFIADNIKGALQSATELQLAHAKLTTPRLDFSMQNQPELHVQNVHLELNEVAAASGTDNLTLKQVDAHFPRLDFISNNELSLDIEDIDVDLDTLNASKANGTNLALKSMHATLPKFAFNQPAQVQFEQLNVQLNEIGVTKGKNKLLNLPQLAVNNIALDLAKNQVSIAQVLLAKGNLNAQRDKAGMLDWQAAIASNEAKSASPTPEVQKADSKNTPMSITIDDIALKNWQVTLDDQSFVHPLQANITDANVNFAISNSQDAWTISKLQSQLNTITLKSNLQPKPVATLAKLQLNQGEIALDKQKVEVQAILLSGLKTEVVQAANAPLNWLQVLETHSVASQKTAQLTSKSSKPNWAVNLKKIALDNTQLHIEDRSLAQPVALDVEKLNMEVNNASLDLARALPVKASFSVKQGGQFNTQGKLTPMPFKADVDLKLSAFSFKPFAPYLNKFALLKLNDGASNINGKLHVINDKTLALTFNGGFSVDNLSLVEEATDASFLAWEKLDSNNLELSLAPNRLHMATLNISKPSGKFIINADKTTNIAKILRNTNATEATTNNSSEAVEPATNAAQPTKPEVVTIDSQVEKTVTNTEMAQAVLTGAATGTTTKTVETAPVADSSPEAFPVTIETVRIENAGLEFADLSLTPQFGTQIHSLTGVINSVSTNPNTTAQVELDGKVDDYGAARVRGALQPFKATNFTDIKLSFTNLEMNRLTPYSGKFAGRKIESGKLSVDLEYKIKQRQLAGENKFVINKLKLGEKVDSKEAANLPLDLAIAILEDSDGVIDLDLPITGSLDDPKFSYGSIVWKAIRNVLGKIVTAPFRALGKLFGGSGDKLEAITFEAGKASLTPPELEKLKAVSTALTKRQGLALGIVPGFDKAVDTRAIQESTIRRQVAEEMDIKFEAGQQAGPIDLSNPNVQKAIDALHDDLTKKGLLKRLASKLEKTKAGHFEEAQEKLTASIEVKEADLQALAKARAETIQKQLVDAGIAIERVKIDKVEVGKADSKAKTVNTRLTLDVKNASNKTVEATQNSQKNDAKNAPEKTP